MGDKGIWREQDSFADEARARQVLSMLQNQSRLVRQYLGKTRSGKYQPMMKYRLKEKSTQHRP